MTERAPIVEEFFDLAETEAKLNLRIYAPEVDERTTWVSRVEFGPPFEVAHNSYGEGSLQALALAVSAASARLYSSHFWREGKLGWKGDFGGYLGVAAPTNYLDFAPYLFDLPGDGILSGEDSRTAGSERRSVIAEELFQLAGSVEELRLRIYAPEPVSAGAWACRVEIGPPLEVIQDVRGESSLQALCHALSVVGASLYGTTLWREGKLRAFGGESSGYLGVAAPTSYLYLAPHPF